MSAPSSRRGFLKGLALFSAAGAPVVAVAASAAAAEPHPDAELLALGADLDREVARYHDLKGALDQAEARFLEIEPSIPDGLRMVGFNGWVATEWPPDHLGRYNPSRVQNRIRIPNRRSLDDRVKELDGRTVQGRLARRLKRLSDPFHEAHEAARKEAGTNAAEWARYDQAVVIQGLNKQIAEVQATTLVGLAVKGRSELAWVAIERDNGDGWRERKGIVALFENLAALGGEV